MNDDPIDEIEWMSESDRVESKRRRREHQRRLERQRLGVVTCYGVGIAMAAAAWMVFG